VKGKKGCHLAFAFGIPRHRPGHGARKAILSQLRQYQCRKVRVDHNSHGHAKGWAWLIFSSEADRDRCCEEMDQKLFVPIRQRSNSNTTVERCLLNVSPCLNSKLCQVFPSATPSQRAQLILDPEGWYSITDEITADTTTEACLAVLGALQSEPPVDAAPPGSLAIDGTAGCGGNTASLIRSSRFSRVIAFESNPERARSLTHNLTVLFPSHVGESRSCCEWTVRDESFFAGLRGDGLGVVCEGQTQAALDLLFLDPPWGGQNYRQVALASTAPVLSSETNSTPPLPSPPSDYPLGDSLILSHLLSELIPFQFNLPLASSSRSIKLVAVKLPDIFDLTSLCEQITRSDLRWDQEDSRGHILPSGRKKKRSLDSRPHPFRLQLGARTALLLVGYPPHYRNRDLDLIVEQLVEFDQIRGLELHPKFFDWEKQRWISLHTWKGCKMEPVQVVSERDAGGAGSSI
jgi:hypothetical protein